MKKEKHDKRINIRMSGNDFYRLKTITERYDKTMSEIIRISVKEYLKRF